MITIIKEICEKEKRKDGCKFLPYLGNGVKWRFKRALHSSRSKVNLQIKTLL